MLQSGYGQQPSQMHPQYGQPPMGQPMGYAGQPPMMQPQPMGYGYEPQMMEQ